MGRTWAMHVMEMYRTLNILHSSYALKTRIIFLGPVFRALTLGSFIIPKWQEG